MSETGEAQVEARLLGELEELSARLADEGRAEDGDIVHDAFSLLSERVEAEAPETEETEATEPPCYCANCQSHPGRPHRRTMGELDKGWV